MNSKETSEIPVVFKCQNENLVGVVHAPDNAESGLVLVSGGDQYRVGSHRLFVELARVLADAGIAVMRFDHRGVGDSFAPYQGFENLHEDIEAAVKELRSQCPTIKRLVLGGLCDGASASLISAERVPSIDELALINPWVQTSDLEARTRLLNYYGGRLKSVDFWKKLLRGQIKITDSFDSLMGYTKMFFQSLFNFGGVGEGLDYVKHMRVGAKKFGGRVFVLLSGQDLVAQQFQQLATIDKGWKEILDDRKFHIAKIPAADHTFSTSEERRKFEQAMLDWMQETARR